MTTSFAFHPARTDPADRDRLRAACDAGGSSLHGTGLNPGNLGAVVPLALSGMCREISRVSVQERADWSMYDRVDITFGQMHFGADPAAVTTDLEVIPASADRDVFGRTLAAGTVAGQRWRWSGRRAGHTVIEVESLWVVGERQPAHRPTPQNGWTITIEGSPSIQAHIVTLASFEREVPLTEHVQLASVATAMAAVNAVAAVCAAPAGFITMAALPFAWNHEAARAPQQSNTT